MKKKSNKKNVKKPKCEEEEQPILFNGNIINPSDKSLFIVTMD